MMTKPKTFDAYNGAVTEAAERVQKLIEALEEVRSLADNDCDGNLSVSILQVSESAIAEWKKP